MAGVPGYTRCTGMEGNDHCAKKVLKLHHGGQIQSFIRKRKEINRKSVWVTYQRFLWLQSSCSRRYRFSGGRWNILGQDQRMSLSPYYGLSSHPAPHFSTPGSPGDHLNIQPMLQGKTQLNVGDRKDIRGHLASTPQRCQMTCLKPHSLVFLTVPVPLLFPVLLGGPGRAGHVPYPHSGDDGASFGMFADESSLKSALIVQPARPTLFFYNWGP